MANAGESFLRGMESGSGLRDKWDKRQANKALAEVAAYRPQAGGGSSGGGGGGGGGGGYRSAAAQPGPQQGDPNVGGFTEQTGMPGQEQPGQGGQGGTPADQARGDKGLPSTRDWVDLRSEALKAAALQGPAALKAASDQIDDIQRKGYTENLVIARGLVEQGRSSEAGKYLEMASSYKPDFNVLVTSPAKMKDGSTNLMGYAVDEQTGQPKSAGMMLTTDVIDHFMELADDPAKFAANNHDRKMALQKAGIDERKMGLDEAEFAQDKAEFAADEEERGFRREFDVEKEKAKYQDKAEAREGKGEKDTWKPKDYSSAAKSAISSASDSGMFLSPAQKTKVHSALSKAAKNPALRDYSPDQIAAMVVERLAGAIE